MPIRLDDYVAKLPKKRQQAIAKRTAELIADPATGPDPLLGSMRDAADELDAIVADAMKKRREEADRESRD